MEWVSFECTPQSIRMCLGPVPVGTVTRKKSPKPTRYIRTRRPAGFLPAGPAGPFPPAVGAALRLRGVVFLLRGTTFFLAAFFFAAFFFAVFFLAAMIRAPRG